MLFRLNYQDLFFMFSPFCQVVKWLHPWKLRPFQKEVSSSIDYFSGNMVVFREVPPLRVRKLVFPDGRDYLQWKNYGFRDCFSLIDSFNWRRIKTRKTEVATVTFRLAVSSDLPTLGPKTLSFEGNPNREQSWTWSFGEEKKLDQKHPQQKCNTTIVTPNGIPTNPLFRCIEFLPCRHFFITQAWSSRRQNYCSHQFLESRPKAGRAVSHPTPRRSMIFRFSGTVASQSQKSQPIHYRFSWGGGFSCYRQLLTVSHLKPSSRILKIPPHLFSPLIPGNLQRFSPSHRARGRLRLHRRCGWKGRPWSNCYWVGRNGGTSWYPLNLQAPDQQGR